ncbi:hypothetical protein TNCV_1522871 [Trichonephila clavipes]|nr:hypothetical protein TNCV_1522871 [Trichonephila clavipes]
MEDLTHPGRFSRYRQHPGLVWTDENPSSVDGCCTLTSVAVISNNSCDNQLLWHFWCRSVVHCSYCKHNLRLINVFIPLIAPFHSP